MTSNLLLFFISVLLLLAVAASGATTRPSSPPPPPPSRKAARSPPPSPPAATAAPANCSDELVSFSKCLPYTSSSPNNTTKSPSRQCCNDVASAFASGNAVCFCYLIENPNLLGFPLNSARVLSVTSLCQMRDHGTKTNFSLSSLCSRTHTLPPLKSITSPEHSQPRISGPVNPPPPPTVNFTQDPTPPPTVNFTQDPPPPPTVNFTQDSQEWIADSDSPAPADSDISIPADSDTPAPPGGSHPVPSLPLIPSWRPFSTNGINANLAGCSPSLWLLLTLLFLF